MFSNKLFYTQRNTFPHKTRTLSLKIQPRRSRFLWVSVGVVGAVVIGSIISTKMKTPAKREGEKKHVVVLGTGWGSLSFLQELGSEYNVSLVSPRNYFLFTPLLPGLTTGTLDDRTIMSPVRRVFNKKLNDHLSYYEAECTKIDPTTNTITCADNSPIVGNMKSFTLNYDYLVLAVGAQPATFGTPGVKEYAHFLKTVEDAQTIRSRIIDCFETANLPGQSEKERKRLLSFVIVGGGPTGCEFAGELHDLLTQDLPKYFPHLSNDISIHLVQSQDKVLNSFDKTISEYAENKFKRDKITLHLDARVKSVNPSTVVMFNKKKKVEEELPFGLCVWSTGLDPIPLVQDLCQQLEKQKNKKALLVNNNLRVKGTSNIYAIGDCCTLQRKQLKQHLEQLFKMADKDGNEQLSMDEFDEFVKDLGKVYPQLQIYSKVLLKTFKEFDVDKSNSLSFDEFRELLSKADNYVTILPSTAQVAKQEGIYLANQFNYLVNNFQAPYPSFSYQHKGSFASLGGGRAVGEVPGMITGGGLQVWLMWRGVYLSKQISGLNMFLLGLDWLKSWLFGRDVSRF